MKPAVAVLLLVPACSLLAQRAAIDSAAHPYVEAEGEATISARPDQARINIGVTTQGAAASTVAADNAKQVDAVLADLRMVLGGGADIKTNRYSIIPNYTYPKPEGPPTIAGYTANNTVQVTLSDLQQVGKVLDAATQSGANSVQGLEFTLKNDQQLRAQALRDAAVRARANAEAMAGGLGVRL